MARSWDSEFIDAVRQGGNLNELLRSRYPGSQLIDILRRMEESGRWRVLWHHTAERGVKVIDDGAVTAYLGD